MKGGSGRGRSRTFSSCLGLQPANVFIRLLRNRDDFAKIFEAERIYIAILTSAITVPSGERDAAIRPSSSAYLMLMGENRR